MLSKVLVVLAILSLNLPACASSITIPYVFVPNTTIIAAQVNANFSTIAAVVNGNLDHTNMSAGAGVLPSQLNLTMTYLDLQSSSAVLGFGVGQTGDTNARIGMYSDGSLQFGIGSANAPDVALVHSATNTVQLNNAAAGAAILDMNGGKIVNVASITNPTIQGLRLSISATLPVPADGTSTTIYALPYVSGYISLYNASNVWVTDAVTSLSIAVPATTNTNYDAYVFDSIGTPTLGLAAWSGSTPPTRGVQNGVPYTNASAQDRWIGSIATSGTSGTTEDDGSLRLVWNYNNQVPRTLFAQIATTAYIYSSSTVRASNANTTYGQGRVGFLTGLANANNVDVTYMSTTNTTSNSANNAIGLDTTTAVSSAVVGMLSSGGTSSVNTVRYIPNGLTTGTHYLQMLEFTTGSAQGGWLAGTTTPGNSLTGTIIQ